MLSRSHTLSNCRFCFPKIFLLFLQEGAEMLTTLWNKSRRSLISIHPQCRSSLCCNSMNWCQLAWIFPFLTDRRVRWLTIKLERPMSSVSWSPVVSDITHVLQLNRVKPWWKNAHNMIIQGDPYSSIFLWILPWGEQNFNTNVCPIRNQTKWGHE